MSGPHIRKKPPSAKWLDQEIFYTDKFKYKTGKLLLGKDSKGRKIGIEDDRHITTIAGSRSGKSRTSLLTNLMLWPGSCITIDPKGELAASSAVHRAEKLGQEVYILDPFGELANKDAAKYRVSFNPLHELFSYEEDNHIDDVAILADALIIDEHKGGNFDHWTQAAKNLIQSLILYLLAEDEEEHSLTRLYDILSLPLKSKNKKDETLEQIFDLMAVTPEYDGHIERAGKSFLQKRNAEASGIISTAAEQLSFLRSKKLSATLAQSDFSLRDLKEKNITIYLVLPASHMATHNRWFRVVLNQVLNAIERTKVKIDYPVLCILEEMHTLGYMQQLEKIGLMAGFGVKLWIVLQDLSQLKAHYPKSWETFIGNSGILETFGNADLETTEYLSRLLGNTITIQTQKSYADLNAQAQGTPTLKEQFATSPLMAPYELKHRFSRITGQKLIITPEYAPFSVNRMVWTEVINGD